MSEKKIKLETERGLETAADNTASSSSPLAHQEPRRQEVKPLDYSDLEHKVNILLSFAVEQCSQGDSLWIAVVWNSPQPKKSIHLYWTLRTEANKDFEACLEERWPFLEKYFQPLFGVTRLETCPAKRQITALIQ